ncbi:MAG: hypothetical protein Q9179_001239 [Wetmoreana sp. 5 TL-2023]
MEKIKNIINPGKSKDDEVMYGSGQSNDPVHMGTGSQAASSHDTNDPSLSSTGHTGNTTRDPVGQGGVGSVQQGSNPVSSSRMPGTFDDDVGSTTSIKSGLPGNTAEDSKVTSIPDTRDPLDTNKALPREPATGGLHSTTAGAGPHSSSLANKVDPRVDSDLDGSSGLGRNGTTGTGSSLPEKTARDTTATTDSGRSFPLGGASSGTTTAGPHTSDIANKADPRVDSDHDGPRGIGTTGGYGSGSGATVGSAHQGDLSHSGVGGTSGAAIDAMTGESLPRGYGEESWTHNHLEHGHEYVGDPCGNEPPAPGAPHFTSGPHSLDTANRLDPHVSGGGIGASGSTTTESTTHAGHHHPGRDAAVSAGLGATGAGVYEASRGTPSSSTAHQGTTTTGPHSSDLMNKMDPRVDSDRSKELGTTTAPGTIGATTGTTSTTERTTGRDHHHGRDAALAGAGAGVGGAAQYEGDKHRGQGIPEGTSGSGYSNPYPPSSTGPASTSTGVGSGLLSSTSGSTATADATLSSKDHHHGRDAGLAGAGIGAGAGGAYEADKRLGGSHDATTGTSQQLLAGAPGTTYAKDTGATGAGTRGFPGTSHQSSTTSGLHTQPATGDDDRDRTQGHHPGRNAAIGAGAGAAAVAGGEELSRRNLEKEREAAHKQELKDQKAAHKQELKEEKHHQHELDKEKKAHEKAMAKEEAKHHKEEAKHHKHEAKHDKEEPHEEKKKHHGLFGFLHRDKPDDELKEDELRRKEAEEGSHVPGVGTTAGTAAGLSEMEKHQLAKEQDRNRLHKDPPPGLMEQKYAEAPKEGYASQVTGGTGTTALAQDDPVPRGSHATGLGNKVDPK